MSRAIRSRSPRDAGGATLFGVFVLGVLASFTTACVGIDAIVVAHRKAQSAADLGSLGAATAIQRGQAACPAATDVVRRNGGRLVRCRVQGETVTLRVEVTTLRILGSARHTEADARAGPVGPSVGPSIGLAPR